MVFRNPQGRLAIKQVDSKTAMKRSLIYLIACVSPAMFGLGLGLLEKTPNQVIHQNVSCPQLGSSPAQEFQVLGTYRWAKGVIVLYSALCPRKNAKGEMQRILGHQVVEREGKSWEISSSDTYRVSRNQHPMEQLIEYGMSQIQEKNGDRYVILYGQFLSPQIAAVEATFDNGQVVRDDGKGKAFALIAAGASHVCELRLLGPDNQLLRQEDLSRPSHLLVPKRLVSDSRLLQAQCLSNYQRL